MGTIDRYQAHLDRVSRSFAFCIARLDGDLRAWVSLAYLLCRALDTVEDAVWDSESSQKRAFAAFDGFLRAVPTRDEVAGWSALFPTALPEGEKALLADSYFLFQELHALPEAPRKILQRSVRNMRRGMEYFSSAPRAPGEKVRLRSLAEVNQYCFFVAGLVGELLTELFHAARGETLSQASLLDAHHFGLFLQKINLLKDQREDEKEGRFLIHSRAEVLASLRRDAEGAIRYLTSLPVAEKGYRLFCAWSLFLGLASLPWIQRGFSMGLLNKIPRALTERLLATVGNLIDDNQALLKLFREMLPALPSLPTALVQVVSLKWFDESYEGKLSPEHMSALGMLPSA